MLLYHLIVRFLRRRIPCKNMFMLMLMLMLMMMLYLINFHHFNIIHLYVRPWKIFNFVALTETEFRAVLYEVKIVLSDWQILSKLKVILLINLTYALLLAALEYFGHRLSTMLVQCFIRGFGATGLPRILET